MIFGFPSCNAKVFFMILRHNLTSYYLARLLLTSKMQIKCNICNVQEVESPQICCDKQDLCYNVVNYPCSFHSFAASMIR